MTHFSDNYRLADPYPRFSAAEAEHEANVADRREAALQDLDLLRMFVTRTHAEAVKLLAKIDADAILEHTGWWPEGYDLDELAPVLAAFLPGEVR